MHEYVLHISTICKFPKKCKSDIFPLLGRIDEPKDFGTLRIHQPIWIQCTILVKDEMDTIEIVDK
jgi:hypothetical protein